MNRIVSTGKCRHQLLLFSCCFCHRLVIVIVVVVLVCNLFTFLFVCFICDYGVWVSCLTDHLLLETGDSFDICLSHEILKRAVINRQVQRVREACPGEGDMKYEQTCVDR